ncbi:hypothetical protein [Geodermatophilus sp. URMC 64]
MAASGSRSRARTRTARPDDLPAVLALVRQHRAEAHAEGVLTGLAPGSAAAAGFRRLLADPGHRVVLAVLPGAAAGDGSTTASCRWAWPCSAWTRCRSSSGCRR